MCAFNKSIDPKYNVGESSRSTVYLGLCYSWQYFVIVKRIAMLLAFDDDERTAAH